MTDVLPSSWSDIGESDCSSQSAGSNGGEGTASSNESMVVFCTVM